MKGLLFKNRVKSATLKAEWCKNRITSKKELIIGGIIMKKRWLNVCMTLLLSATISMPVQAAGEKQSGQENLQTAAADADVQNTEGMFEQLPVPDLPELGVHTLKEEQFDYSVDAYDGKIYVTSGNLAAESEGKDYAVVLIYDEKEQKWSAMPITSVEAGGEFRLVAGGNILYLFSNLVEGTNGTLTIYKYNMDTRQASELKKIETSRAEYGSTLVYYKDAIWMIGGQYLDADTDTWKVHGNVVKFDVKKGTPKKVKSLKHKRVFAQAEVVDDKIVVTGGTNASGAWEHTAEVWNEKDWEPAADYPPAYVDQQKLADAKIYNTGSVVSGNYLYVYGDTDHADKGREIFCRVKVREQIREDAQKK